MRILPFLIGEFQFVHTGEWDRRLDRRAKQFLLLQNDKALLARSGQLVQWCPVPDITLHFFFAVLDVNREFNGTWAMLDVEYTDRAETEFTATMSPAIFEMTDEEEEAGGWQTTRRIGNWLLDNPMPVEGGGTLQLVRTKAPTGESAHHAARLASILPRKRR